MTKRLGRGLADLIGPTQEAREVDESKAASHLEGLRMIAPDEIREGQYQPRRMIGTSKLDELKESIRRQGVIEPVIVRPIPSGGFELVAGERRWQAAKALGMRTIPALVRELSNREALEYSLIENIQREDLNPIEEAKGYARLLDEFGYTQENVADAVGKDRATVANLLRVLRLPERVQSALAEGTIALGHAKVLAGIELPNRQEALCAQTVARGWSVRQLEHAASSGAGRARKEPNTDAAALEAQLRQALGTKVGVLSRGSRGKIVIEYYSTEDLNRLIERLCGTV
ncbi:MAG TPA: ParB/RepB/Spo0J family partition protein [bacterium]